MPTVIHKYSTLVGDVDDIIYHDMPVGARVVSVANVPAPGQEWLAIYAEVNPSRNKVKRKFRVAGTGHPLDLPTNAQFVGTAVFMNGRYILHVYDCGEV